MWKVRGKQTNAHWQKESSRLNWKSMWNQLYQNRCRCKDNKTNLSERNLVCWCLCTWPEMDCVWVKINGHFTSIFVIFAQWMLVAYASLHHSKEIRLCCVQRNGLVDGIHTFLKHITNRRKKPGEITLSNDLSIYIVSLWRWQKSNLRWIFFHFNWRPKRNTEW